MDKTILLGICLYSGMIIGTICGAIVYTIIHGSFS